ncbi:HlyD family type I secretion periplasmic adaptor subunit [Alsobacter sp. R-9]
MLAGLREKMIAAAPRAPLTTPVAPTDWQRLIHRAWWVIVVFFGLGGLWSVTARLDQGAIAPGVISVASNRKAVQHLEGGIVREVRVRDGDLVEEGAVVVRLDETQSRAALEVVRKQLAAALAEEARLVAERDLADQVTFPDEVRQMQGDPMVDRAVADQVAAFRERRTNLLSQQNILEARIQQVREGMAGTQGEKEAGEEQVATIRRELAGLRDLLAKNLVQLPRVLSLEREEARLKGVIGRAVADMARYEQTIGETRIQIQQLRQQFLEGVSRDLPAVRKTIAEMREKMSVQIDVLRRVEIRAPQTGVVQSLKVFTVGGVVRPGEVLMEIVPVSDELVIRAKVSPLDVDNVHLDSTAEIRFPAFSSRHPPIFFGKVRTISRDRLVDDNANRDPYFAAEVTVDQASIPKEFRDKIVAGMSADVVVAVGERTAIWYILGPLLNRLQLGMREH